MKNRFFRKYDIIIVSVLLLASAAATLVMRNQSGVTAKVIYEDRILYEIDLASVKEDYVLTLENGVELTVSHGAVSFSASPCKGQDCVKAGVLTKAGQISACLPMKTAVVLTGRKTGSAPVAVAG